MRTSDSLLPECAVSRWVVPLLWLPLVAYAFRSALLTALPAAAALLLAAAGVVTWQLVEYCIHRWGLHVCTNTGTNKCIAGRMKNCMHA